ncbi:MAG TPA: glycosyltransferase family 4 protein [Solirubrobacteraceae bacterium]|jgi:glycosyltransferase involved in cell wall biosynthesis|nr:glycosyltransferase family 4 protein [Solirubrobacteraceae bacterium]
MTVAGGRGAALMLAAHPPGSGSGSSIRGQVSLSALRHIFERVDAVSLAFPSEQRFADPGVRLIARPAEPSVATRLLALTRGGALYIPERAARLVASVRGDVDAGALLREYDLVWCYSSLMAHAAFAVNAGARVLDIDNVAWADSLLSARTSGAGVGRWQRLYRRLSVPVLAREERRRCGLFDRVLVTSQAERERLGDIRAPVGILPNSVPEPEAPIAIESTGRQLLFVGALDYEPNVDAVRWLLEEVLPLLRTAAPDAAVTVAGRNPGETVRALCRAPQVGLAADVDSLEPLYRDARVVIAPLRLGGGSGRIKVLEAMAHGAAIVATSTALDGLGVEPGREALVADDAAGFANACATLLRDVDAARRLGGNARAKWRADHAPAAAQRIVREVVDSVLPERR